MCQQEVKHTRRKTKDESAPRFSYVPKAGLSSLALRTLR